MKFTSQIRAAQQRPWLRPFIVVMGVSFCVRLLVVVVTSPYWEPDSLGYMGLARYIGQGNLAAGEGYRTPGYPVFLLLHDLNPNLVRITQMTLGLCITAGLYWLISRFTASTLLASIGALLYGANVAQIFLESTLMAETLATALLFGAVLLLVCLNTSHSRVRWNLVALGLLAGVVPLVRPIYVFVPVVFIFPVAGRACRGGHWRRLLLYLLPAMLPVILWVGYLSATFDYVGLSTSSGFAWTNQAGAYMQDAPDKYATIRDIYLRYVARQHGDYHDAIWAAIPEMEAATGESYPQLSKTVQRMSLAVLAAHPGAYVHQVGYNLVNFWKGLSVHPGWRPAWGLTITLWKLARYLGILVNGVFLLVVSGMVLRRVRLLRVPALPWPAAWMAAVVLITAIEQAVLASAEGQRYGMPTQPFVWVVAMLALGAWVTGRRRQQSSPTE